MSSDEKVVFKAKKSNPVALFIAVTLGAGLACFLLLHEVLIEMLSIDNSSIFTVIIVISGGIGALIGYLSVAKSSDTIIELDGGTFRMTKGKKVTEYPISNFAGSHVTRNYTNGVYTGSTRYLKFKNGSKEVKLMVPLKDEEFAELVSRLGLRCSGKEDLQDTEEAPLVFEGFETFEIPRDAFIERNSRKTKRNIIVSIVVFIVAIIICGVIIVLSPQDALFAVIIGCLAVVLFIGLLLAAVSGNLKFKKNLKSTPSKVTVDNEKLMFDNDSYYPSDIASVVMTPSRYEQTGKDSEYRVLRIKNNSGDVKTYYFGRTQKGDPKMMYEDYGKLLAALFDWCAIKKIHFLQVLG